MQLNGIGWGRTALGCFHKGIHGYFHLCRGRTAWEVNHFFWVQPDKAMAVRKRENKTFFIITVVGSKFKIVIVQR
jgi:hypothetical protein